nr:HIRAN domain-containing protein [Streptococcus suis]
MFKIFIWQPLPLDVIDQLKPGTPVQLVGEPSNPHDSEAVAIFYQGTKLGYIPSDKNSLISRLINLFWTRRYSRGTYSDVQYRKSS